MADIIRSLTDEDRIVIECLAERCRYNKVDPATRRLSCGKPKSMTISADHQCNYFTSKREE